MTAQDDLDSASLRDFFACAAMHALIASFDGLLADDPSPMGDANLAVTAADDIARHAYLYAAAMLKARAAWRST